MSCTENESGPFVVFFLPAVVGCLTILLARRWANSQVSNPSSTAVSRRRKIIKDPLVKRPLPPIACPKMVQPGSKKVGFAKKGTFPATEEESNGGGKRVRPARLSPLSNTVSSVTEVKALEGPIAPKHIPFPYIPQDGDFLFEAMTFVFTMVATGLQFLNLYRTAWWLPQSHTTQAMNFYLIDPHLVAFIIILKCRRVVLCGALALARHTLGPRRVPAADKAAKYLTICVQFGMLALCSYFIILKFPLVKLFFLFYPAVIYLALFGAQVSPYVELVSDAAPPHCCSHDASHVRREVAALRADFNTRVKKILYNSIEGAYYSSFVPLCFAQSYLYYDVYAASQQVAFVWGGLFARYCSQLLPANYCDVAHRASLHLIEHAPESNSESNGEGSTGAAASGAGAGGEWRPPRAPPRTPPRPPSDTDHHRFFAVFINPSLLLCLLLCLQLSLIALQLCLLFSSISWHHFLSIVMLLFINYYTLFKMVRDYLVAWKVYKAENMIQEKNYAINNFQQN